MAAHEHLAAAQFHHREGRPNKHEHAPGDEEEPNGLKRPRGEHIHRMPKPHHAGHRKHD